MTFDTINNAVTMPSNGEDALLADRYRIVRQLGQGGMGSVWLVEDTQLDNIPFAVKMLPSILVSNKRAYRQLKDEARVAMKLTHPNIVALRAFEENGGNPFLVMDYVDGQTLDDYLAEQCSATGATGVSPVASGIPEADVIRILRPIAAALDYAHEQGVVHRDVKPANVLIRKDGHPFILDFGIAREVQETMTRMTGALSSGTLPYMSPEQLRGARPTASQDVYSFAAMAYECLAGEPPFSRGQIEFQILNEKPAPLPRGTQLVASVMSGLEKEPRNRPMTCSAVLGAAVPRQLALQHAVTPPIPELPQRKTVTKIRLILTGFAAILLVAAGGWFVLSRNADSTTSTREEYPSREKPLQSLSSEERAEDAETPTFSLLSTMNFRQEEKKRKTVEAVSDARTALEVLYMRSDNMWPPAILNARTHEGGFHVMDENVAKELFRNGLLNVDCKKTEPNKEGLDAYTLRGVDRFGIADPWAQDVLRKLEDQGTRSSAVPSGGTVEDHLIYFAVDQNGDGFVDVSEGAPVKVRAEAITWCAGADGDLGDCSTDKQYKTEVNGRTVFNSDNVYSWQRAQEVHLGSVTTAATASIRQPRERQILAMKQTLQNGIAAYKVRKDKWPGKLENWAKRQNEITLGYLSNGDYDDAMHELLKASSGKSAKSRVMDPVGLTVIDSSGTDGKLNCMDWRFAATRMEPDEMTVVYPKSEDGKAYRFVIEYNTESDEVSVMTQDEFKEKTRSNWTGSEVWR